jgi:hypothetical protein
LGDPVELTRLIEFGKMESQNETTETAARNQADEGWLGVNDFLGAGPTSDAGRQAAISRLPGDSWLWLQL